MPFDEKLTHLETSTLPPLGAPQVARAGSAGNVEFGKASADTSKPKQEIKTSWIIMSAAVASGFATLVGHPMDSIKVRLQEKSTFKHAIWRNPMLGNGPALVGSALLTGLTFGVEHKAKKILESQRLDVHPSLLPYLAGGVAGAAGALVITPTDRIKILQQLNTSVRLPTVLKSAWQDKTLYRGFCATVIREVPASMIYFGVQRELSGKIGEGYAGAIAGVLSWITTVHLDRIKTATQSSREPRQSGTYLNRVSHALRGRGYSTYVSTARSIYAKEGHRGFFSGAVWVCVRAAIYNYVLFQTDASLRELAPDSKEE